MKRVIFIIFNLFIVYFAISCNNNPSSSEPENEEIIEGTVITNDTLSGVLGFENSPYIIRNKVLVPRDSTLIIEAGVKIYFKSSENEEDFDHLNLNVGMLLVYGNVIANGTDNKPILFSRANEKGYWGTIFLYTYTFDVENSFINCKFEYGNRIDNFQDRDFRFGTVTSNHAKIVIKDCIVQYSKTDGVSCTNSFAIIDNSIISNNLDEGISCDRSDAEITNNILQYNSEIAILLYEYSDAIISENIIIGLQDEAINYGISLIRSSARIINNSISNCRLSGIYLSNTTPNHFTFPNGIIISNNIINDNSMGISIRNSSMTSPIISNNMIRNNTSYGISISSQVDINIYQNIIDNNKEGISISGSEDFYIYNNVIRNNERGGIICRNTDYVSIVNNEIINNGNGDSYLGGVYLLSTRSDIINNLILGNHIGIKLSSLRGLANITNCNILNNEIGITISPRDISEITNSIIYNNVSSFVFEDNYSGTTNLSHSLLQDSTIQSEIIDLGNNLLESNPLFVDEANDNYQLSSDSPCINQGFNDIVNLPEYDLLGNPRIVGDFIDIGVYEYQ